MPTIKDSGRRTVPRHAMAASGQPAVTIKSRAFTMPILHINNTAEPAAVVSALDELLETHRDFFAAKIPVVLDLSDGAPENQVHLHQLINALKKLGLLPCAVVGDETVRAQAMLAGLGVFGQQDAHRQPATAPDAPIRPQESGPRPSWPFKVVKGQVRSGQQIHAPSSDIVVLGSVNAGAEVMADGSIHVYGVLRGRALAGAHGNQEARIFCHALEAELVAIAGFYLTAEELNAASHGKPSCIRLEGETVVVEAIVA